MCISKARLLAAALALSSMATHAAATDPRVDGVGDAAGASIIINEVKTDRFPQVDILATVLRADTAVTGLLADDFRVREEEVDQAPLTVEAQLPPLSVVLTIDTSGSMAKRLADTKAAAKAFVGSLGARDSVQVVGFARQIHALSPMVSTKDGALQAIEGIVARGDTALYDAVVVSVDLLAERRGRRAVVLLSDGVDDDGTGRALSEHSLNAALSHAEAVGLPVFVIGLGTEMDEAVLSDIAQTTGGRYLNAPTAADLSAIYEQISAELSGQYLIRYRSNLPADGAPRRIDLAALGALGTRRYTPPGRAGGPAPPPATTAPGGDCALTRVQSELRAEFDRIGDLYARRLIARVERDSMRAAGVDRTAAALEAGTMDLRCAQEGLAQVGDLYGAKLIARTDRDALRATVTHRLETLCAHADAMPSSIDCFAFANATYGKRLISRTERDALRAAAFDAWLVALADPSMTDAHLAEVDALYRRDLISRTQRDRARQAILKGPSDAAR